MIALTTSLVGVGVGIIRCDETFLEKRFSNNSPYDEPHGRRLEGKIFE